MVAEGDQWKYGHPQLHKVAAVSYWKGQSPQDQTFEIIEHSYVYLGFG